jgi:N-acetylglucosaminyl-diphospho-decaprenol L-rhamnosyltransferase
MRRRVCVVLVTHNSGAVVSGLVRSLPAAMGTLEWELVVVDNASEDASLAEVLRVNPSTRVVKAGRNLGYAPAINLALGTGFDADAVLIVNPDVRLWPGSVPHLLGALDSPGVGMAVPRTTDGEGRLVWSMRREPTVLRALGEAVLGGEVAGRWGRLGELVTNRSWYEQVMRPDWASGAVVMASTECLESTGLWDESFWMYSEETDFMLRARDRGFGIAFVPEARATHLGGNSGTEPQLWATLSVNRVRLFSKRHGRAESFIFWLVVAFGELLRARRPRSRAALRALLRNFGATVLGDDWEQKGVPAMSSARSIKSG